MEETDEELEKTDREKKRQRFRKFVSFEDPIFTIKTLIYVYLLNKVSILLGDRFILLIVLNVFIFYAPVEKKFPHFLFYSRMYTKQVIEGCFGILECLIPRYEEEKPKNK